MHHRPLIMPVRREVCRVATARFQKGLDICCGTGAQCIMLEGLVSCCRVDLSASMLRVAGKKPRTNTFLGRTPATSISDDSFDCAVLSFALHEKEARSRHQILTEAKRVLELVEGSSSRTSRLQQTFSRAAGLSISSSAAREQHYRNFGTTCGWGAPGAPEVHGLLPTMKDSSVSQCVPGGGGSCFSCLNCSAAAF